MKKSEKNTAIRIIVIFGNRNDTIKAIIYQSVRGKVAIRPIRPAGHKWEDAKKHLLTVRGCCLRKGHSSDELVTILDPAELMAALHLAETIAL